MNNMGRLIKSKTISFHDVMLRNYAKLGLTETEAMLLSLLYIQQEEENRFLSVTHLKGKTALNEEVLSNHILSLVQKGFIELVIDNEGKETFHLDNAMDKMGLILEHKADISTNRQTYLNQLLSYVETTYQRTAKPADLVIINQWIEEGYEVEEIRSAILESLKAKKMHLRYADAILVNRKKRATVISTIDDDFKQILDSVYVRRR